MSKQTESFDQDDRKDQTDQAETEELEETGEGAETEEFEEAGEAAEAEGSEETEEAAEAEGPEETEEAAEAEGPEEREGPAEPDETEAPEEFEEADDGEEPEEPEISPVPDEPIGKAEKSKKVERPKKRTRKHRKKNWLLRLLIAVGLIAIFVIVANMSYFQITEIPVIGNKAVSDKKILKLSGIEKGDSIFLINTWSARSRIKNNRYIKEVTFKRHMPGTVEIIVREREPAAQFIKRQKNKTRYVITDETGMVMKVSKKQKDVTMVSNVRVLRSEKGSKIEVDDKGTYKKAMDLIAAVREGDLYFKRIIIRGSRVTAYIFDGLKCKGRYDPLMESIQNGQLKAVVYKLYQEDVSEGTINIGENNYCSFTPEN